MLNASDQSNPVGALVHERFRYGPDPVFTAVRTVESSPPIPLLRSLLGTQEPTHCNQHNSVTGRAGKGIALFDREAVRANGSECGLRRVFGGILPRLRRRSRI